MKLVIIIPPSPWLISDMDQPMMGALYVASYVKCAGYQVQVCDLSSVQEESWRIPIGDLYGITGVTPNFPWMKKIIKKVKEREPHKLVVVGGVHATVLPNHILDNTLADICVVGEGEHTMLDLLNKLSNSKSIYNVNGICTREFVTPARNLMDLNSIPFPDRDAIDYYEYMIPKTYKYLGLEREGSIITSRGCPYKCAYCGSFKIHKGKTRFRSASNVIEEITYMKRNYDMGLCNFVDDTFTLNSKRVYDICNGIKALGIKWFFLTRVDEADLDLYSEMVNAGCVSVTYGFESGSNKILSNMRKGTTVEQAYEAIRISKKAGLKIRGQLMVGIPGETDRDVDMTADFIKKARGVDTFGLHVFQPYPGCSVWENPSLYGWSIQDDNDFSTYHTIGKRGAILTLDKDIQCRYDYLKSIIADRSIDIQ